AAALPAGAACRPADLAALQDSIATNVAKTAQPSASGLLRDVTAACRRNAAAPGTAAALAYAAQLVAWWKPIAPSPDHWLGSNAEFWDYLTTLFRAVGYTIDNTAAALEAQGFIGVCRAGDGCTLIAPAATSGIKLFPGALGANAGEQFLVTGRPAPCAPIDGTTDIRVWGQCIEVSVDPKIGASFKLRPVSPVPALVQTCMTEPAYTAARYYLADGDGEPVPVPLPDATTSRVRLAQKSADRATVALRPRPAPSPAHLYDSDQFFEGNCTIAQLAQALLPAPGPVGRATRWFGAARSFAAALFAPRVAYAAHGGLGSLGIIEELSTFGPADPFVFEATFDNPYASPPSQHVADVPGAAPVNDDIGRAAWEIEFQAPGFVRVRATPFGGFAAGTNVVEVNQAGGASDAKRGLTMFAALAHFADAQTGQGQQANAGKYRIRWTSSVASPRAGGQGAPFVAASIVNGDTLELARFAYVNGPSAQSGTIRFAGQTAAGLAWAQNTPARYELVVDLYAGRAYLRADGAYVRDASGAVLVQSFTPGRLLTHTGWRLGRQDNQVLATDDVEVVRLADTFATPQP
ncbi:hypothetical protein, partial [Roseisolibacter sp. H3M3-2]|uniref:hypothetical protein n=1 Tax=Roseisolibacter sp. H3M3-2 TaxID=3031323 RepID=UPI0023DAF139